MLFLALVSFLPLYVPSQLWWAPTAPGISNPDYRYPPLRQRFFGVDVDMDTGHLVVVRLLLQLFWTHVGMGANLKVKT